MLNHIWIFSDSIKGHEVQSLALANRLSTEVSLFHCTIRQPWLSFAPRILPRFGRNIIWKNKKPDVSQMPDAIITCGRRMAAIGKFYKRLLGCKHIQILNPGDNSKKYDILICPEHDGVKGDNVITTQGSLHGISLESLARIKCSDPIDNTVVVFLGNPGKVFFKDLDKLLIDINTNFPKHNLVICGSRRTPKKQHEKIRKVFSQAQLVWLSENDGENPYLKLLACGQVLLVTADSINMLSEACATDKPVIALGGKYISPKHKRFIKSIDERLSLFESKDIGYQPLEVINKTVLLVINHL